MSDKNRLEKSAEELIEETQEKLEMEGYELMNPIPLNEKEAGEFSTCLRRQHYVEDIKYIPSSGGVYIYVKIKPAELNLSLIKLK